MDEAKIRLSQPEMELVTDPNWILTKNIILDKVKIIFGELHLRYKNHLQKISGIPEEVLLCTPKISKGENYSGLPWVMLDYPRHFGRQDVFAIRTFFWWGNFFSITLQLSGHYKEIYKNNISGNIDLLEASGFFICINEDPWVHHFETDNYIPVKKSAAKEFAILVEQKKFIKLSAKLDLKKWDECTKTMEKYFQVLIKAAVS